MGYHVCGVFLAYHSWQRGGFSWFPCRAELSCPQDCFPKPQRLLLAIGTRRDSFLGQKNYFQDMILLPGQELSECVVEEGQAGQSERWTDSTGLVKELLWMGSCCTRKFLTGMTPLWILSGSQKVHIGDFLYNQSHLGLGIVCGLMQLDWSFDFITYFLSLSR